MTEIKNGQLGIEDAEFWTDPWKNIRDIAFKYVGNRLPGLVIDGPKVVPLKQRESFPVGAFYSASDKDARQYRFPELAILTAVRLEDRYTFAAMAMEPTGAKRNAPSGAPGDGFNGQNFLLKARTQLDLPWKEANYIVRVLMLDRSSNAITAQFDPGTRFDDPEVKKYLDARPPAPPAPVFPQAGDPLPNYGKTQASPPIPNDEGVALAVERVIALKAGVKAVLYGSYRLRLRKGEWARQAAGEASAILPITLVITGSQSVGPIVMRLRCPSYDLLEPNAENQYASGYFALDLFTIPGMRATEQTYFIYALAGEVFEGPVLMALVSGSTVSGRQ